MIHDKSLWQKINFDFRAPTFGRGLKVKNNTYPNAQKIQIQYIRSFYIEKWMSYILVPNKHDS